MIEGITWSKILEDGPHVLTKKLIVSFLSILFFIFLTLVSISSSYE